MPRLRRRHRCRGRIPPGHHGRPRRRRLGQTPVGLAESRARSPWIRAGLKAMAGHPQNRTGAVWQRTPSRDRTAGRHCSESRRPLRSWPVHGCPLRQHARQPASRRGGRRCRSKTRRAIQPCYRTATSILGPCVGRPGRFSQRRAAAGRARLSARLGHGKLGTSRALQ